MTNKYTAFRFVSDTHKECSLCGEIKQHSEFHKDSSNKRGKNLAYYCKECANEKAKEFTKKYSHTEEYKNKKRNNYIQTRFGLTLKEYLEKLKAQKYVCAICKVELPTSGSLTHLDHCHTTGKIRAFLCTNCNRGLGHFKDSIENLKSAIIYLESHNSNVD